MFKNKDTVIFLLVITFLIACCFLIDGYGEKQCINKNGEWHGGKASMCIKPNSEIK